MRVRIIAVGKLKETHYRAAVDEYVKRLRHYCELDEVEVKDGDVAALKKQIPARAQLVLLTIDGTQRTSEGLAAYVEKVALEGKDLTFVIGGADGIPPEILALSSERLSLGKMTLPHRLARLVLVEQVYRAMTIRKGEPYHH